MNKTEKSAFGKKGEEIACNYLKKKGYKILATNWHFKHKEIDIIAMLDNTLIIIEVKTRSNEYFERPQDAVNKQKQRFLIQATNAYIIENEFEGEVRFDIVSVIITSNSQKIGHIEDAFYPTL